MRFTLTAADLVAAYHLQSYARLWSLQSLIGGAIALAIVGGFVAVAMPEAPAAWIAGIFGCALLGGIIAPLAMIRWRVPALARRIYAQQRGLHGEIAIAWDRRELRATTAHGYGHMPWADYIRWREDRHIILLFQSEAIFQMLPKRVLSPADLEDIRSCAIEAGLKGTGPARA